MKRIKGLFVIAILALSLCPSLFAQGYLVTKLLEPGVYGRKEYGLRVIEVLDDTHIRFRDFDASSLPGGEDDYVFRLGITFLVEGKYVTLYQGDKITGQYTIAPDLSLAKIEPGSEAAYPGAALMAKVERVREYRQNHRDEDRSFYEPINGYAIHHNTADLGGNLFLYRYSDVFEIWRAGPEGEVSRKQDMVYKSFAFPERELAVTEYAPGRYAYATWTGLVKRFTVGPDLSVVPIEAARAKLDAAIGSRDLEALVSVLNCQEGPLDVRKDDSEYRYVIRLIAQSRDTAFVLGAMKYLSGIYAIPFLGGNFDYNPVFDIIAARDAATLKAVLDWRPDLATRRNGCWSGKPDSFTPFSSAVKADSTDLCEILLSHGASAENDEMTYFLPTSSYTYASSVAMRAYLQRHGARDILPCAARAVCRDDRVRIRKAADTGSEVLGYLSNDDSVETSLVTAYNVKIDDMESRWFKVKTENGVEGWVYGAFLTMPSWDGD